MMADFNEFLSQSHPDSPAPGGESGFDRWYSGADEKAQTDASVYAGSKIGPDSAATVLDLSGRTGVPADVVERNVPGVQEDARMADFAAADLSRRAPAVARWAGESPHNAALIGDDADAVAKVEEGVQDYSWMRSMVNGFFKYGMLAVGKNIAQAPGGFFEAGAGPANLVAKMSEGNAAKRLALDAVLAPTPFGIGAGIREATAKLTGDDRRYIRSPEWALKNSVTDWLDKKMDLTAPVDLHQSVIDEAKKGNVVRAGQILAVKAASNFPSTIFIIGSSLAGGGVGAGLSLGALGAGEAGQTAQQSYEKGLDVPEAQMGALAHGTAEVAGEYIGSFGVFKAWEHALEKELGKELGVGVIKEMAKTLTYSFFAEGNEELWTQMSQDLTDYITGLNPDALNGMGKRAFEAFLVGGASGAGGTSVSSVTGLVSTMNQQKRVALAKDFYLALGGNVEATKAHGRLPAATREIVDRITKDTPVENIYVPVEAVEKYFQSGDETPIKFMQGLGALESYTEAKSTGGHVKIPLSVWAEKVVGTDHYKALANDITFDPNELTVNQVKDLREKVSAEAEKAKTEPAAPETVIAEDVSKRLQAIGFEKRIADSYAQVYGERYKTRAGILGVDPLTLFRRENVQFTRTDAGKEAPTAAPVPEEFQKAFTPSSLLSGEQVSMEAGAASYAAQNMEQILSDYEKAHGNEISTDKFRDYLRPIGYTGLNSSVFHEPAAALRRVYQQRVLEKALSEGKMDVVLMAGGSGAGKTSSLANLIPEKKSGMGAIIDANLSDFEKAKADINAMISRGMDPRVWYVYREPVESWVDGVIKRVTGGSDYRVVPLRDHLRLHKGSYETIQKLAAEFPDRVTIIDNSLGKGKRKQISVEELASKGYNDSEIRRSIINETIKLYEEGKIGAEIVRSAFAGALTSEETKSVDEVLRRGPLKEHQPAVAPKAKTPPDFSPKSSRVMFEVAPDPNNTALLTRWRALHPSVRQRISSEVANSIVPGILDAAGVDGKLRPQIGGYLDDTNPSFALVLPDSVEASKVVELTKLAGLTLSQDSMMTVSEHPFAGAEPVWSVNISLPADAGFDDISKLYSQLREIKVDGEKPVSGHTTVDGQMVILNYSKVPIEELAKLIDEKTSKGYNIETDQVYAWFPGKEEYDYAGKAQQAGDTAPGQSPLQGDANRLRGEATRAVEEAIARYEGQPAPQAQGIITPQQVTAFNQGGQAPQVLFQPVSTRMPTAVKAKEDHLAEQLRIDLPSMKMDTEAFAQNVRAVTDYVNYKPSADARTPAARAERFIKIEAGVRELALAQENRGQIRFGHNTVSIDLFEKANLSTVLHETGHLWMREMSRDAADLLSRAPETLTASQKQFLSDVDSVKEFLGVDSIDGISVEQHEKWARAAEAYFMEGKSPSQALRGAFARFRAWLISIYKTIRSLDVNVPEHIRGVMDRLVAAQEEIDMAESEQNIKPLFADAKSIGMNDSQAASYVKAVAEARTAAEEELSSKLMGEVKREQSKSWVESRQSVQEEISLEINQRPEYIALSILQRGALPMGEGERAPEGLQAVKLSKDAIVKTYGEEWLAKLPKPYVYSVEGGIHPEQAAELFGFDSGEALLNALATATPKDQLIKTLVDQRMKVLHGDMMTDGTIAESAMQAVHNDKRAELLRKELEILASDSLPALKGAVRRFTRRAPTVDAIRNEARAAVALKSPRDIHPSLYQRAETSAAKEAIEAVLRGDFEAAFEAKRRELVNHELYRAASEAKEEIASIVDYLGKFAKDSVREKIGKAGGEYLDQIDAISERYDFRKGISLRVIDSKKSLLGWVQDQVKLGYDVQVPEKILNEARRQHYKDTPYEELLGVRDTVKTIEHLARLKNELLANERHRTLDEARGEIISTIMANHKTDVSKYPISPTVLDKVKEFRADFVASHTKIEFLLEHLDGGNPVGAAYQNIWKPFLDAKNKKSERMQSAMARLREIFSPYSRSERALWYYKRTFIPEIGEHLNKAAMISVALNWGNQYNREALMEGYKWRPEQVQAILDKLDQRDWQTVQAVWDYIDSYWPDVRDLEKRVNGLAPEKVQATTVETKFGPLRGGYYPISFDTRQSWRQRVLAEGEAAQDLFGGQWARAMTRHGHTVERTNTGGKPLYLDLSVLTQHVENVIHDLSYREAVIDVARLLENDELRQAIQGAAGNKSIDELQTWVRSIAGDRQKGHAAWLEGLMRRARGGATTVNLGLKVTSGLAQTLGYLNTVKEIGPKYAALGLKDVFRNGANLKKTWGFISEKSSEMRYRLSNYDRDVRDTMRKLNVAGTQPGALGVIDAYTNEARESFFFFIGFMDLATSVPTWLGAYQKALDGKVDGIGKADDTNAVLYADKVVRETQSAGDVMDLARIQRGNDYLKMFTMFYSQASLQFNQFAKAIGEYKISGDAPRMVASMALMWFLPAVLEELIRGRKPDDDEEWWKWVTKNEIYYPFQTMIFMRDIVSGMERQGYEPSPAFEAFKALTRSAKTVGGVVSGDKEEVTRGDIKNIVNTVGYFTALPTRQTWQTLEYFHDWMTGDEQPANAFEGAWRALVTGKPKE